MFSDRNLKTHLDEKRTHHEKYFTVVFLTCWKIQQIDVGWPNKLFPTAMADEQNDDPRAHQTPEEKLLGLPNLNWFLQFGWLIL